MQTNLWRLRERWSLNSRAALALRRTEATVRKGLREAGVYRSQAKVVRQSEPATQPTRYGYQDCHRTQGPEQGYTSSFTDAEWALVADIFDNGDGRGMPPRYPRRALVDACCYVVRTGCSWRRLPSDFPPWKNVYRTFRRWAAEGRFEAMHDRLRNQWREREGRSPAPAAAVLDAESTRSSPQGGPSGFDAGKKVKGRKRNFVVDTLGLLLAVTVTTANVQDRDAAPQPVEQATAEYPGLQTLFVDNGYAGQCAAQISAHHNLNVDVVRHPANRNVGYWQQAGQGELFTVPADSKGFTVLPKRWVVERTHAWNQRSRRLVMHHDRRIDVSEAWVWLAGARLLAKRLIYAV